MNISLICSCNIYLPFKLQIFILLWYKSARTIMVLTYYFQNLECCMQYKQIQ